MKNATYHPMLPRKEQHWIVIIGSLLWLALMLLLYIQSFVPVGVMTRDPATLAGHPAYYGALSNLGILLWSASAAVCFLSAALLKAIQFRHNYASAFFITFAGLNTVLCLDDTYLLHEEIFRYHLPIISIPEQLTILSYAVVLAVAVSRFWVVIKKTQLWLLGLSLLLFLVAASSDYVLPEALAYTDISFLLEDGTKLLGIFLWLIYFSQTSIDVIVAAVTSKSSWQETAQTITSSKALSAMNRQ